LGHEFDLPGSRDVIGHATIWFPMLLMNSTKQDVGLFMISYHIHISLYMLIKHPNVYNNNALTMMIIPYTFAV